MSLNIKNPETHRLARELAHLTGESVTQAVTQAIRERLERYGDGKKESRREWLERISATTAPLMKDGRTSTEMLDELYDPETGLPK